VTENIIIARWGEIHLKGANRGFFLKALKRNLESSTGAKVAIDSGRAFLTDFVDLEKTVRAAADTFGIVSVSPVVKLQSEANAILNYLKKLRIDGTFKVEVNRSNKAFPHKSLEFAAMAGGVIDAKVDVRSPQTVISIDIRESTYVYSRVIEGVGGLPVGTAGRALVMLSGGIDSPVAAYLAAKRGLAVDFIHFVTPPYTSEFALEKVRELAKKLGKYCGKSRLYIVPITEMMEEIKRVCNNKFMITIMRRFFVRIAERIALENKIECLVTGENLSQVASQTVAGIASNNVCARVLPILRPLVTYDKGEIVELARRIDTYETSCIPHPDCCTVFVPQHPIINPKLEDVEKEEAKLDVEGLVKRRLVL
jgi:thiamine biosynthesis protein ThiI